MDYLNYLNYLLSKLSNLSNLSKLSKLSNLFSFQNNTTLILKSYTELFINKVFIVLIPLITLSNIVSTTTTTYSSYLLFNLIRIIVILYIYINLLISDTILRQSLKIRTVSNLSNIEHSCEKCSVNVIWNLQDTISNLLFNVVGCVVFK